MKPMMVLLALGIGFIAVMYVIAVNNFEGVVVSKAYESSLLHDTEKANNDSVKDILSNVTATPDNNNIVIDFVIDKSKSAYDDIAVKNVVLSPPMGVDILLSKADNGYATPEKLNNGWYKLKVIVEANNTQMVTSKSLYIEN